MKYQPDAFIQTSEFNSSFVKLSEKGKESLSCQFIKFYYQIASINLRSIREALTKYRDCSSQIIGTDPEKLKPHSYRFEFELVALISSNLMQMPDLESIIKKDNETTDEDKLILLGAYQGFKNKIDGLFKLFGWPSFGILEEKEVTN
jgi:hypothetical protein